MKEYQWFKDVRYANCYDNNTNHEAPYRSNCRNIFNYHKLGIGESNPINVACNGVGLMIVRGHWYSSTNQN